ncbi:tetratricopeptide repeat-containing sensor histidine kinase [Zobellia uliginosa]|uniref:tetratricopeptide repeat-containing sensor histidine kinase n=1 Tax=Zobellia uliginosa TaxID=143224 RepID=UPI001C07ABE7|nr:tetratricopeptide repeat protein [Zobellia uliginosa]MBU2946548.1 tetratricopeptide repeat-containing sensor histidine kinase [Zobellia uliginosa]
MKYSILYELRCIMLLIIAFYASSYTTIPEQTYKEDLAELKRMKASKDFNAESEKYIDLLIRLGNDSYLFKPDSTTVFLDEAYDLSKRLNYFKGQCGALNGLGNYYTDRGNLDLANSKLKESLAIANTHNLLQEKLNALNFIGLALWQEGKNGIALTKFLEALPIAEKINDVYMMGAINDNIALLYDDNKDYDTALLFNEKSRQISIKNNLDIALAQTLLNMAVMYNKQEKYAMASKNVDDCINIFKETDHFDWLGYSYHEKGSIILNQHNYKEAQEWFEKALKIFDEIDLNIGYARTYMGMARSFLGLSNLDRAEDYGLKALKISEELKVFTDLMESNFVLSQIYHEKGEHLKAYEYLTEYLRLFKKSSAENYQKGLGVLRSEIKFEDQKKLLIEENKSAIAKQRLYIFAAFAASLVLAIFLISLYKTHKIQKKLNKQLQIKQEDLIKREAELQEANETKDKLFSVIAHDLRGPINSFHSLLNLYVENGLSKEQIDMVLPKALHNIKGISDMLNNLLVWGKTQLNGTIIKPSNVDIRVLVNENIELMKPLANKKSITLFNNIPKNIISFSDRDLIDIVLRNLISNAVKFTNENGEVNINVVEMNRKYRIEVKDNGVGMAQENQSNLFDKNNTKTSHGTNNEKGSGLGLSLSKEMVESNGGTIWAESKLHKGTSIFFTVPFSS